MLAASDHIESAAVITFESIMNKKNFKLLKRRGIRGFAKLFFVQFMKSLNEIHTKYFIHS